MPASRAAAQFALRNAPRVFSKRLLARSIATAMLSVLQIPLLACYAAFPVDDIHSPSVPVHHGDGDIRIRVSTYVEHLEPGKRRTETSWTNDVETAFRDSGLFSNVQRTPAGGEWTAVVRIIERERFSIGMAFLWLFSGFTIPAPVHHDLRMITTFGPPTDLPTSVIVRDGSYDTWSSWLLTPLFFSTHDRVPRELVSNLVRRTLFEAAHHFSPATRSRGPQLAGEDNSRLLAYTLAVHDSGWDDGPTQSQITEAGALLDRLAVLRGERNGQIVDSALRAFLDMRENGNSVGLLELMNEEAGRREKDQRRAALGQPSGRDPSPGSTAPCRAMICVESAYDACLGPHWMQLRTSVGEQLHGVESRANKGRFLVVTRNGSAALIHHGREHPISPQQVSAPRGRSFDPTTQAALEEEGYGCVGRSPAPTSQAEILESAMNASIAAATGAPVQTKEQAQAGENKRHEDEALKPKAAMVAESPHSELLSRVKASDSSPENIRRIQELLAELSFNPGLADGRLGPSTRAALIEWKTGSGESVSLAWTERDPPASRVANWDSGSPPKGCHWVCKRESGCPQTHNKPAIFSSDMVGTILPGQMMGGGSTKGWRFEKDSGNPLAPAFEVGSGAAPTPPAGVYSRGTTIVYSVTIPQEQDGWARACP